MASACRRGPTRRFWQSWPRAAEVEEDSYLLGGEIERFEQQWATLLGKESAVFMPSGTLANHLALRALAGTRRRVIVPETSHIYNDTGDACQTLSGLTLLPLAPGAATFTRADIEAVLARTASGRVATDVGAIAIESPVRRLSGQMFDWAELGRRRGAGPGPRHRPPPRRRAAVHRLGLHRPQPGRASPRRSTPSTCRCGSTSTAARGRSSPARAACSRGCSTPAGCSAATWPSAGRRRWSPATTWTGSWSGCGRRSRCPRRSIAPSARTHGWRSSGSPTAPTSPGSR